MKYYLLAVLSASVFTLTPAPSAAIPVEVMPVIEPHVMIEPTVHATVEPPVTESMPHEEEEPSSAVRSSTPVYTPPPHAYNPALYPHTSQDQSAQDDCDNCQNDDSIITDGNTYVMTDDTVHNNAEGVDTNTSSQSFSSQYETLIGVGFIAIAVLAGIIVLIILAKSNKR